MLIFRLCNLILILLAYRGGANAQPGTEIQNNGYGYLGNFDSSMAVVIVFLVFAFFLMGLISIYIRRCAESAAGSSAGAGAPANSGSSHRKGLDQAVIDTFPILVYSAVKDLKIGKEALECAVCLSEFDGYETLRLLPKCDHVFHPSCIDAWLASHVTCPVCRANLAGDPKRDSNPEDSGPVAVGEVRNDDVAVNVDEDQNGDPQAVEMANVTVRSEISRKLSKSHSTGHSLIRPGDDTERFTLRLPAEVRRQLVSTANNKLRRSASYDVVFPRVGSSRRGYRDGDGGGGEGKRSVDNQSGWFDPWALLRTPSFLARVGSVTVKSPKGGDADGSFGQTPSRSVRSPLDCLNVKADKSNESISQLPV